MNRRAAGATTETPGFRHADSVTNTVEYPIRQSGVTQRNPTDGATSSAPNQKQKRLQSQPAIPPSHLGSASNKDVVSEAANAFEGPASPDPAYKTFSTSNSLMSAIRAVQRIESPAELAAVVQVT